MPTAENNGIKIHYETQGQGEPLVLMHGTTGCYEDWIDFGFVEQLAPNYQCILIDARGHGASDKPLEAEDYSLLHHVNDVLAVLDALNIKKARYAGYSRGGWIGYGMAKYAQERCRSLIIGGAQPFTTGAPVEKVGSVLAQGMEAFIQYAETHFGPTPEPRRTRLLQHTDPEPIRISTLLPRENLSNSLANISVPCLLYCGETDPLYFKVKETAPLISGSVFLTLPKMNHMQAMEKGREIAPHFLSFLKSHGQG